MKRIYVVGSVLFLFGVMVWSQVGETVPVFARKYGFNCTMCHSNYPRLNDFGARYRQNGYQLPGRESEEKTVIDSPPPFAARTSAGFNLARFHETADSQALTQFQLNGLDLISAGLLYRNIGYMAIYPPPLPDVRGIAGQPGTLEMANVIFSNIMTPWLNIRVGRFEPAYTAFSVKRQLTVSPYEIYDYSFDGGYPVSETQEGVEVTGHGHGFEYAAGWINGSAIDIGGVGSNKSDDVPSDFYLRLSKVFGEGEGQTAGQRIGLSGQFGRARPYRAEAGDPVEPRENFLRGGVDASFNVYHFNLALAFMVGQDDKALWQVQDPAINDNVLLYGGFGELSFMPLTRLVVLGRYDAMSTMDETVLGFLWRATGAARIYFFDNVALHLEYSFRQQDSSDLDRKTPYEHFATTRVDFAF